MTEEVSVTITRQEKYRFLVDFGANIPDAVVDEPPPLGGGAGPSPVHLLAPQLRTAYRPVLFLPTQNLRKSQETLKRAPNAK